MIGDVPVGGNDIPQAVGLSEVQVVPGHVAGVRAEDLVIDVRSLLEEELAIAVRASDMSWIEKINLTS